MIRFYEISPSQRNFQRALVENGLRLKAFDIGRAIDVDHASDLELARKITKEEKQ